MEKKYKCNKCDKIFDMKCNYIKHINIKKDCASNNNHIEDKDDNNIFNIIEEENKYRYIETQKYHNLPQNNINISDDKID